MGDSNETFEVEVPFASVAINYSGTEKSGQVFNATIIASEVSKSTEAVLNTSKFTNLVDQSGLKNIKPIVIMAVSKTRRVIIFAFFFVSDIISSFEEDFN